MHSAPASMVTSRATQTGSSSLQILRRCCPPDLKRLPIDSEQSWPVTLGTGIRTVRGVMRKRKRDTGLRMLLQSNRFGPLTATVCLAGETRLIRQTIMAIPELMMVIYKVSGKAILIWIGISLTNRRVAIHSG